MTQAATRPGPGAPSDSPPAGGVAISGSPGLLEWLERERLSLAFTTYQTNRLFLLGRRDGRFAACERLLDRPMGLHALADRLLVATRYQLWRFENVLAPGERHEGADRLYVPRAAQVIGEVDAHDLGPMADGRTLFVNTLYSCLAVPSERHSFEPLWRPPFVSRLAPEDRCHLNGVAMDRGEPRYVTAVSRSDVHSGWRERRHDGGVVIDVATGEPVVSGLSMPHSPRLHRGELWVLDSGHGNLCRVDLDAGRVEPIAFCPGYLRGLALHRDWAVVGLSKPRDRAFQGLPLQEELERRDAEPRCGIQVIELATGNDTVQYSALFVRDDLRGTGAARALVAEAIRKRLEIPAIRHGVFLVDARNEAMLRFAEGPLRPLLAKVSELKVSKKVL